MPNAIYAKKILARLNRRTLKNSSKNISNIISTDLKNALDNNSLR